MRHQWIAAEHYRLHTVESWADGPHKDATLRAIRSTLASLEQGPGLIAGLPPCEICLSRRKVSQVVKFPAIPRVEMAA